MLKEGFNLLEKTVAKKANIYVSKLDDSPTNANRNSLVTPLMYLKRGIKEEEKEEKIHNGLKLKRNQVKRRSRVGSHIPSQKQNLFSSNNAISCNLIKESFIGCVNILNAFFNIIYLYI